MNPGSKWKVQGHTWLIGPGGAVGREEVLQGSESDRNAKLGKEREPRKGPTPFYLIHRSPSLFPALCNKNTRPPRPVHSFFFLFHLLLRVLPLAGQSTHHRPHRYLHFHSFPALLRFLFRFAYSTTHSAIPSSTGSREERASLRDSNRRCPLERD